MTGDLAGDPPATVQRHVYLGHGASGDAASMAPFVDGLRKRGLTADSVNLPVRKAEDAVAVWRASVPDGPGTVVGGQSYGGRVSTLAAAQGAGYAGIVLFCFPLHPPGRPENAEARSAHFPSIDCPVLLLSGEADPFAQLDLLRRAVATLPHGTLVTYPRVGHTMKPVLSDALDRVAAFVAGLPGR
ncbi:MAG: alpha/beta family hydrolase [Candidatus Limnocylindrales bacterium]